MFMKTNLNFNTFIYKIQRTAYVSQVSHAYTWKWRDT